MQVRVGYEAGNVGRLKVFYYKKMTTSRIAGHLFVSLFWGVGLAVIIVCLFLIVICRFNKQTFSSMGNKKEVKIFKRKRKSLYGEFHTWQNSSNFECFPIEAFKFLSPISFYPVAGWKIAISNSFTEYKHKILKRYVQKIHYMIKLQENDFSSPLDFQLTTLLYFSHHHDRNT